MKIITIIVSLGVLIGWVSMIPVEPPLFGILMSVGVGWLCGRMFTEAITNY